MSVCDEILEARSALKTRKVNVIHRTTSETIRLGEPDLFVNNSTTKPCNVLPLRKKPVSSFQVTGISVTQRPEFGEDSADDLDESHTDDISRITDNETPSFSEESFSRDIEEVPIISPVVSLEKKNILPISPCYELAIAVEVGDVQELSVICTDITDNSSEFDLASVLSKMTTTTTYAGQCVRIVGGRFKVVKIETAEPFRRGRWSCLDYLDQSVAINPHIINTQHMNLIITDPIAYYSNANNNNATVTTGQHATEATFNSNFKTDQIENEPAISTVPTSILTEIREKSHLPVHGQTFPAIYYCSKSEIITTASTIVSTPQNYRVSTKVAESLITKVCQNQNYIQTGFNQDHGEFNQDTGVKGQTTGEQKYMFQGPPVALPNYNLSNVPISYISAVNHGQTFRDESILKNEAVSGSFDTPLAANNLPNFGMSNLPFSRPQQHNLRSAYSLPTGMPSTSTPVHSYTLDSGVRFFATVSDTSFNTNAVGQPINSNSSSSTGASCLASTSSNVLQRGIPSSIHSSHTLPCIHQIYQIQNANQTQQSTHIYSQSLPLTNLTLNVSTQQNQMNNSNVCPVLSAPVILSNAPHQTFNFPMVQSQTYAVQNYTAKSEQNNFSGKFETPLHSQSETCYTTNQPNVEIKELYYNKAQKSPKMQHHQSPTAEKTILSDASYQIDQTCITQGIKAETVNQSRPHDLSFRDNFQVPVMQKVSPVSFLPQEKESPPREFRNAFLNSPMSSPVDILKGHPLYQSSPIQSPTASINPLTSASSSPLIYAESRPQLQQPATNECNFQNIKQLIDPVNLCNEVSLSNQSSQISGGTSLLEVIDEEEDNSLKEYSKTIKSEIDQSGEASTINLEDTKSATTLTPDDDSLRINRVSSGNGLSCANNANAAIDNKIEKAMDLVKSHLMYTVREEVDVLKEKIVELMDRINQLEIENNYLKANVSPEVLTALNNGAAQAMAEKEADDSKEEETDEQKREQ